jgi:sulfoxide reductase heme-binding subunit YedZ
VALDLLIALVVTSLVRGRLGYRTWRRLHWLAYACWPVAVAHGLGIGTDRSVGWVIALTLACMGCVCAVAAWRVLAIGVQ